MNSKEEFLQILERNKAGEAAGVYAVCSAHETVLLAGMEQARDAGTLLLVEATSNQVNQFGGYTGMTPPEFAAFILRLADSVSLPRDRLLLGGDHWGPNSWQDKKASQAMALAEELVADSVESGFQKIHLDASMPLADDPGGGSGPLAPEVAARRTAQLCQAAEKAFKATGKSPLLAPLYIVGTEVPLPGGALLEESRPVPTSPEEAARTIEITREAFFHQGLQEAWQRVAAVVVQPGVEFGDDQVFDYSREEAAGLKDFICTSPSLTFEAHSTDYQREESLRQMVEDHFCILKVGPWLTFAYREALYSLAAVETELCGDDASGIKAMVDKVMRENPGHWEKHYHGKEPELAIKRVYSYSDRIRYYWPEKRIVQKAGILAANLRRKTIPLSMLGQFMPLACRAVREGKITPDPGELIRHHIKEVLSLYSRACGYPQ